MVNDENVRVLIADDNRLFSSALETILSADERIEVVAAAADGDEAVRLAAELEPDVVLMDLSMPVRDGFVATRQIREQRPAVRVLVVTGSTEHSDVERAQALGAVGYVTKDRIASELVASILSLAGRA